MEQAAVPPKLRAYGADRLRVDGSGRLILSSRYPKGWHARIPRRLTKAEHPGTAVLWDEEYYEVVEAHALPLGVRYVLERWKDQHIFRVVDRYDEESEAERAAQHRAAIAREKRRKSAVLMGIVLGHLPSVVQEHLASELGVSAVRLTTASTIPGYLALAGTIFITAGSVVDQKPSPLPLWATAVAMYLGFDALFRFKMAWLNGRPFGSFLGWLGYAIYWLVSPRRRSMIGPFEEEKGSGLYIREMDEATKLRDSWRIRAPLFSLLSPVDQLQLAERHGFDYREHAGTLAAIILTFSGAGMVTSLVTLSRHPTLSAVLSLLLAGFLTIEQIVRFVRFRTGPAGSVLGALVRPLAAKFLTGPLRLND